MKPTVLIIDDDKEFAHATASVLNLEGYHVRTSFTGPEGLEAIKQVKPNLVLLDVMMGHDTEGFELARAIRKDDAIKTIPIIMVTGIRREMNLPFSFEEDENLLPVNAVLEKPVPPEKLARTVKTLIEIEKLTTAPNKEDAMNTITGLKTALIIDDNADYTETTGAVLKANDIQVATAPNGTEGVAKAQEINPDLILLDVMMENDTAGLDTLNKLRENKETAEIPVFLITGIKKPQFLLDSYKPDGTFPNVKKYFEKPLAPEKLLEAIETL